MPDVQLDVSQAAANWIWLVPGGSFESAIHVGAPESHVLAALRLHVDRVRTVEAGAGPCFADIGNGPAGWAYVDLDHVRHAHGSLSRLLAALRPALRSGGYLCLACRTEDGRLGSRLLALWRMRRALRAARNAGFRTVRRYYAEPDPDAPITLVPSSRTGATIHELLSEPVPHRQLRLRIAGSALHPLLFHGHLCLCTA